MSDKQTDDAPIPQNADDAFQQALAEQADLQAAVGFDIPATPERVPADTDQSVPDWARRQQNDLPGLQSLPVMVKGHAKIADGWCGGGKIKTTLCPTVPEAGQPGCLLYNSRDDQCNGPACEAWRVDADTCINYKPRL